MKMKHFDDVDYVKRQVLVFTALLNIILSNIFKIEPQHNKAGSM